MILIKYFSHKSRVKLFFYILSIVCICPLSAQKTKIIDTTKFKCSYKVEHLYDTIQLKSMGKDVFILQIGSQMTKCFNEKTAQFDSIMSDPIASSKYVEVMMKDPKNTSSLVRPSFSPYIYRNYKEGKTVVVDKVFTDNFIYEEDLEPQNWEILEDTITILDYFCQKAICNFRGRDYEAWFASDIPISEGPWKFFGLPGLILRVHDTKKHYVFEINGFQQIEENIKMDFPKKFNKTTRLEFLRFKMGVGADFASKEMMAKVGISSAGGSNRKYDNIEKDYK